MGPLVARVSAAMTTPPSNRQPTMVVPVLVALGNGIPWAWSATLRLWLEKSKPGMVSVRMGEAEVVGCGWAEGSGQVRDGEWIAEWWWRRRERDGVLIETRWMSDWG